MDDDLSKLGDDLVKMMRELADVVVAEHARVKDEAARLRNAIIAHHAQKADDRCIEDDDQLYAAAGLPPCDRRVGDKDAMLHNCERFIANRCQGGGWRSYAELERELAKVTAELTEAKESRGRTLANVRPLDAR